MTTDVDIIIKLVELVALVGGGGTIIFKLGRAVSNFEELGKKQTEDIGELKFEMKNMVEIITRQALQGERITAMGVRFNLIDKALDELRHGNGFVFPLSTHLKQQL